MLTNSDDDLYLYMNHFKEIAETMFTEMGTAHGVNVNFVREMIPPHEGAIRMSNNALAFNICPNLKPILQAIITSQSKG